jgi:hypothetical protein
MRRLDARTRANPPTISAINFSVLVPLATRHGPAESAFASLATQPSGLLHHIRSTVFATWHV